MPSASSSLSTPPHEAPAAAPKPPHRRARLLAGFAAASVAVAGLGTLAAVASTSDVEVTRPGNGPMRVLFAGDSITYGLFAGDEERGYRPLMVDALSAGGPVAEFRADRPGAGAGMVSSMLNVPKGLDLAVVELGTNDVVQKTPIAEFKKTYGALLTRIHTESPRAPLLCVGTWGSAGGKDGSDRYNKAIETECAEHGGEFVSLYGVYPDQANRGPAGRESVGGTSDSFHPNDRGYRAIAKLLLERITVR